MTTDPIDFYGLELLLDDNERSLLHAVRDFGDKQVAPIINDHWNRATFPFELLPALRELGTVGTPYTGYNCPGRSFLLDGFAGAVDPLVNCRLLRFQPPLSWYTVSACTPGGRVN